MDESNWKQEEKKRSRSGTHRPHREAISKLAMTDFGWPPDFLLRFHFLVSAVTKSPDGKLVLFSIAATLAKVPQQLQVQ